MDSYSFYQFDMLGFAGFWRRALAFAVDVVLVFFAFIVLGLMLSPALLIAPNTMSKVFDSPYFSPGLLAGFFLLAWLYSAGFESSTSQATIGKITFSLAVVDQSGYPINFWRASLRFLAKLLTLLTLGIGFLLLLRDKRKQALHDKITGTLVIVRAGVGMF